VKNVGKFTKAMDCLISVKFGTQCDYVITIILLPNYCCLYNIGDTESNGDIRMRSEAWK